MWYLLGSFHIKEILRSFEFSKKIAIFRQKSRFLTYVNFSLSAKFNRFFIILGGLEEKDQKNHIFKKDLKIGFFLDFLGFSRFSIVAKNVIFRGFLENSEFQGKLRFFTYLGYFPGKGLGPRIFGFYKALIYVKSLYFLCFFLII